MLDGKVAVITGAASGLGRATLTRYCAEGASVVALDLQDDRAEALEAIAPGRVTYQHCDVTVEDDIAAGVERAVNAYGRVDVAISNAGTTAGPRVIDDFDGPSFDLMMHQHPLAALLLTKHAVPHMRRQGGGSIIITGSTSGMLGGYGPPMYSLAKATSIFAVKMLAVELAGERIRVNCISPGLIATEIHARAVSLDADQVEDRLAKMRVATQHFQPLLKSGVPEDVAAAAAFLGSDDASFITGVNFPVDGGLATGVHGSIRQAAYEPVWQALGRTPTGEVR